MHNIDIILLYMLFLLTECVCVSSSAVLRINGNFKVDSKRRIRDCIQPPCMSPPHTPVLEQLHIVQRAHVSFTRTQDIHTTCSISTSHMRSFTHG